MGATECHMTINSRCLLIQSDLEFCQLLAFLSRTTPEADCSLLLKRVHFDMNISQQSQCLLFYGGLKEITGKLR